MKIYKIQKKNFDTSEDVFEIAHYDSERKAVEAALKWVKEKKGSNIQLKEPEPEKYRFFRHVQFDSYYGNCKCAIEIVPIEVQ